MRINHLLFFGYKLSVQSLYMNIKRQNNGYRTNRILGTSLQTFPERQKTIKRSSLPPPRPHSSLSQSICRDAKQTRHVIRRSDISGGSQAEEDGSNTLRWLAAAQRCNYAPPPPPQTPPPRLRTAFDVARWAVKALTEQTVNISAICPILFAFRNEAH